MSMWGVIINVHACLTNADFRRFAFYTMARQAKFDPEVPIEYDTDGKVIKTLNLKAAMTKKTDFENEVGDDGYNCVTMVPTSPAPKTSRMSLRRLP